MQSPHIMFSLAWHLWLEKKGVDIYQILVWAVERMSRASKLPVLSASRYPNQARKQLGLDHFILVHLIWKDSGNYKDLPLYINPVREMRRSRTKKY